MSRNNTSFRNKGRVFKVEGNGRHRIEAYRFMFICGRLRTVRVIEGKNEQVGEGFTETAKLHILYRLSYCILHIDYHIAYCISYCITLSREMTFYTFTRVSI